MLELVPFTAICLGLAACSWALGRWFPECLLQVPARWLLYFVAGLMVAIVGYTLVMALLVR